MSDTTTWAVLGDGRYIRIMINQGAEVNLFTLRADDLESYAKLCYGLINFKAPLTSDEPGERSYSQLVADFLTEQFDAKAYDRLVIAAPETVIKALRATLPEKVKKVIVGELPEDILAKSCDEIEQILGDLLLQAEDA